jgi:hypothetical protein
MLSSGNAAFDGYPFVLVLQKLSGVKNTAAIGELNYYGGIDNLCCFHDSVHRIRSNDIDCRQGKPVCPGDPENFLYSRTGSDSGSYFIADFF